MDFEDTFDDTLVDYIDIIHDLETRLWYKDYGGGPRGYVAAWHISREVLLGAFMNGEWRP